MAEIVTNLTSAILWASYGYWMRGRNGISYGWLLVAVTAGLAVHQFTKGALLS